EFPVENLGHYLYTVSGWIDPFQTWYKDFLKRVDAEQDVTVDLQIGVALIKAAAERADGDDARKLQGAAEKLQPEDVDEDLAELVMKYPDRTEAAHYKEL